MTPSGLWPFRQRAPLRNANELISDSGKTLIARVQKSFPALLLLFFVHLTLAHTTSTHTFKTHTKPTNNDIMKLSIIIGSIFAAAVMASPPVVRCPVLLTHSVLLTSRPLEQPRAQVQGRHAHRRQPNSSHGSLHRVPMRRKYLILIHHQLLSGGFSEVETSAQGFTGECCCPFMGCCCNWTSLPHPPPNAC